MPGQQACEILMLRLNLPIPNERQIAASERILKAYAKSESHLNPEFLTQVIADLDTMLFEGLLGDYMLISWESMAAMPCCLSGKPYTQPPYEKSRKGSERLRVRFAICSSFPKEQTWGGILHELLHAYLDLTSEWHGFKQPHGPLFSAACTAIIRKLALDGLEVQHVELGADWTGRCPLLG